MEPQRRKLLASSKPPTLRDIESVKQEIIHTSSTLPMKEERALIFEIPAQKGFYIDLSLMKIYIRYRILKKDGSKLTGDDEDYVCAQSGILYTMFKDLEVCINNRAIFWGRFLYPYYTNLLLNFKIPGNERKMLYSSTFKYDDNNDMDQQRELSEEDKTGTPPAEASKPKFVLTKYTGEHVIDSWEDRAGAHHYSQEMEVFGNILFDTCFQERLLRDDANLRLSFTPHRSEFCLFAESLSQEYVLEITKASVHVPRVNVRPASLLPRGDIDYYFVEHRMMTVPVAAGTSNFNRTITTGNLPRRLILSQIEEKAFNGDYHLSCFRFPHFDIAEIQVTAGATRFPADPLSMDFDSENILHPYIALFDNMKNSLGFSGLPTDRYEYQNGRVYFAFDCTKDMEAGSEHWVPGSSGNLALNIYWKTPLPTNIVLVLCLEYEKVCKLDKFGQAEVNYAPLY